MNVSCDDISFTHLPESESFAGRATPPSSLTDEQIWAEFRQGSQPAFEHIYTKYFPVLYNYGRQFTADSELVKDIIQDLFIYLQQKRSTLSAVSSIKFYLYKSFRNRIIRHLNRNIFVTNDFTVEGGFDIALNHQNPEAEMDEDLLHKMQQALQTLSARQREIIMYYYYEGFSYAQITTIMGFGKIEYARILMSRTILKLRKMLGVSAFVVELILAAGISGSCVTV
jgi:RNA polymerase sigma factor (sigma-70 family)